MRRDRSGTLDWRALSPYERFLARRVGDRDEWVIGIGDTGTPRSPADGGPLFGHITYDLRSEVEGLAPYRPAPDELPLAEWWTPRFYIVLRGTEGVLHAATGEEQEGQRVLERLLAAPEPLQAVPPAVWTRRTSRERYLEQVRQLLAHIRRGDIYEVNYCTERAARIGDLDPYAGFARLMAHTDAPFAAFHRSGPHFALCASPERFLRVENGEVITQPMKGTRRRSPEPALDADIAAALASDPKERSENVMAVDVARHDLSRIAAPGSVVVDELCGVKTYATVHQLVSTVRARLREGFGPADILCATFPMASMTGAPKRRAMQLIEEVENMRRGLFSGTLGFFLPDGTADLNVVIRTMTFNAATGHASLITGGAITAGSDPEQEWEECELKARSVLNAFGHAD